LFYPRFSVTRSDPAVVSGKKWLGSPFCLPSP
jgi:hypothetical protein